VGDWHDAGPSSRWVMDDCMEGLYNGEGGDVIGRT
jgi:hypothetical protein